MTEQTRYESFEIELCQRTRDDLHGDYVEVVEGWQALTSKGIEDAQADAGGDIFWTVYGRKPDGEVDAIADCQDRERADHIMELLDKGRRYDSDIREQKQLRETAMVIWEHALTCIMRGDGPLDRWKEDIGTAELRTEVAALAESVDKAWAIAYKRFDYDDCFDWEFVPDLLNEFWGDDPANAQDEAFAWCKALSEILGKDEQLVRMLWQEEFGADLEEID